MFNRFARLSPNCLRPGVLAFPERLKKLPSRLAKGLRKYLKLKTISFVDFCPMERRE
jgi:hypothetical protein